MPTRRAARALAGELCRHLPFATALLPRIVPLGQMEGIETNLIFNLSDQSDAFAADLPLGISPLERRLVLSQLVLAWSKALQRAQLTRSTDAEPEALLVAPSPVQAWHLSGDLSALIDEIIIEDIEWSALDRLAPEEYDQYWSLTTTFLKIAADYWPKHLKERGFIEQARRQAELALREAQRLGAGLDEKPVIAIGSTGTNRATARLLAAIATAPRGAVVLPGLDLSLDEDAWSLIGQTADDRTQTAAGHPQAALFLLLPQLGINRCDVREIGTALPALAARTRFLGEAFIPYDATDRWLSFARTDADQHNLTLALEGVTLIEAADEREEALALAIQLREVLERPNATAALITPDRALAKRVRADLARWDIEIDDSGGQPLANLPAGTLARLILAMDQGVHKPHDLLAVLEHPAARFGFRRAHLLQIRSKLEIGLLRTVLPDTSDIGAIVEAGQTAAEDHHAHPARKAMSDEDWDDIALLLRRIEDACTDWRQLGASGAEQRLDVWVAAHRAMLAAATTCVDPDDIWPDDDSTEALTGLFDEITQNAAHGPAFDAADYGSFLDSILRETIVRGPTRSHPRLKILGLLEARLLSADVLLLGGLDETVWPPQTGTDAFLNRPMRATLGLSPPERRIGQTAHDFVQAMGAQRVILSRAAKRGGAPTVPSRFLQRMAALAGESQWAACRARGERSLELARLIDQPAAMQSIPRPAPTPSIDLRPTKLSVTRIETLRRDPYAIYAEFILKLLPMEPIGIAMGAREVGTQLHGIFSDFTKAAPLGTWPEDAASLIDTIARERLGPMLANAEWRIFHWPRVAQSLAAFLTFETSRRPDLVGIDVETSGRLALKLADDSVFELTGTADRIERLRDGTFALLDYKSGGIPSTNVIGAGFAPQMPLEALMIERGAFPGIRPTAHVSQALHVGVFAGDDFKITPITGKETSIPQLIADHENGLHELLSQFRKPETGYVPRPFPQFVHAFNSYDHLSRTKEWSAGSEGGDA